MNAIVWWLLKKALCPERYIWMEVTLIHETPKAILVMFDNRKAWIPNAWIIKHKQTRAGFMKIKISESRWAIKFL